jgi:hypothetical protein
VGVELPPGLARRRQGRPPTGLAMNAATGLYASTNKLPAYRATISPVESRPVFADPSGRRHRIMRRLGIVAASALIVCLGAIVVAMAGGPKAPLTSWAAPHDQQSGTRSGHSAGAAGPRFRASPSAQASPKPNSGTAARSGSPGPTNRAGRTPPGQARSPNPHKK